MILIAFVIAGAMLAAWCCAASRGWMPSIFGWYVAVASARTSVSVTTPCCEVSRGALDSKAGSVHCSGVMAGAMGKGIVIVRTPAPVDASALRDPAGKLPEAVQDAHPEMAVARFKLEGVSGDMLIEHTK